MFTRISPRARRIWIVIGTLWLAASGAWTFVTQTPDRDGYLNTKRHAWRVARFKAATGISYAEYHWAEQRRYQECFKNPSKIDDTGGSIVFGDNDSGSPEPTPLMNELYPAARAGRGLNWREAVNKHSLGVEKCIEDDRAKQPHLGAGTVFDTHKFPAGQSFGLNAPNALKALWTLQWFGLAVIIVAAFAPLVGLLPLAGGILLVHWFMVPIFRWIRGGQG